MRERHVHHVDVLRMANISLDNAYTQSLDIYRKGTSKFIYYHQNTKYIYYLSLHMRKWVNLDIPYMLYEGNSCIYGGIYIVKTLQSKDVELLSLCALANANHPYMGYMNLHDLYNISLVIVHYSEYSSKRLIFYAEYVIRYLEYETNPAYRPPSNELTLVNQQYFNEATINFTVSTLHLDTHDLIIQSDLLKLRKCNILTSVLITSGH